MPQKHARKTAFEDGFINGHAVQATKQIMTKKEAVATRATAFNSTHTGDKARIIQMSAFQD